MIIQILFSNFYADDNFNEILIVFKCHSLDSLSVIVDG